MANKKQSTLFDERIEDPELEDLLAKALELEPGAASYRSVKKDIRKRIEGEHADLINSGAERGEDDESEGDEEASGWVICGDYRFRPKAAARAAGEVKIGAGINWTCPVERVEA